MTRAVDRMPATAANWELIYKLRDNPLQPQDFKEKWGVTNADLAELLGVSVQVVERWFFSEDSPNKARTEQKYLKHLAAIDFIWTVQQLMPSDLKDFLEKVKKK